VVEPSSQQDRTSKRQAILIVEDEILIRLSLEEDLIDAGFVVLQAADAAEALEVLQSAIQVDLLISDVRMPGAIDGVELVRRARAFWPQLKIVLISGNVQDLPPDLPADAIFDKPYVPAVVIPRVKELLSGSEQWRTAT
jgi:two-component system, response regulator PdtaR